MKNEEALIKLKEARAEALANSSNVKIGMRELNTAIKALETIISIKNQRDKNSWVSAKSKTI